MCFKAVVVVFAVTVIPFCYASPKDPSVSTLLESIYRKCFDDFSTKCIKARSLDWISRVAGEDKIIITNSLSIVRTGPAKFETERSNGKPWIISFLDTVDNFLGSHSLQINAPSYLKTSEGRTFIADWFGPLNVNEDMLIPLASGAINANEGRGFVRKVMIPFLLGLKFKTSVMVPLALALIALKTWKAMTFGLLSLVVSAAIVIFKLIKPNVVNYEVIHHPHGEHIVDHHVEHHLDHHLGHHLDHHVEHFSPYHPPENYIHEHVHTHHESIEPVHIDAVTEVSAPKWEPQEWSAK